MPQIISARKLPFGVASPRVRLARPERLVQHIAMENNPPPLVSLPVDDAELVEAVQAYLRHWIPGVVCELKDYGFRIGCGFMGEDGVLHEHIFLKRGLDSSRVEIGAQILLRQIYPDHRHIP